jgi:hypothetical protein
LFRAVSGGWVSFQKEIESMGLSVGLFVFAAGAILRYAVSTHVDGINLNVVGVILMIVGVVGAVASAVFWSSFSPYDRHHRPTLEREQDVHLS